MAYCPKCGARADDNARFCGSCASELPRSAAPEQTAGGGEFVPGANGKYYWYYELNMFKNPTILLTLIKVFGGIFVGIYLLVLLASMGNPGFDFFELTRTFGLIIAGFLMFVTLVYFLYAAVVLGSKYCVVFEMDKKTVTHTQLAKQFQRAQAAAGITVLLGMARGSLSTMATGMLAGSRGSMTTEFALVSRVRVRRRRNVIYLKEGFSWNQIYVPSEHFDEALRFMLSRIPPSAKYKP